MRNKFKILVAILMVTLVLGACGSDDEELSTDTLHMENTEYSFLTGMEDGTLYVLHPDGKYQPVVFDEATFDKYDVVGMPQNNRIMWFKENYSSIPTFSVNEGDKLVMYTTGIVSEENSLERFKDMGISVGLCQLKQIDSGKYTLSTNPDDRNSYPNSDADELLNFMNEKVVVDKINDVALRTHDEFELEKEKGLNYDQTKTVSEFGTITDLNENDYYDIDVYDGTRKTTMKLQANVHIFGSCDIIKKLNYHFEYDNIQVFELPDTLPTGYYSLNALGLFRVIAKDDVFTTTTDFNRHITREDEEAEKKLQQEQEDKEKAKEEKEENEYVTPQTIKGKENKDEISKKADDIYAAGLNNKTESEEEEKKVANSIAKKVKVEVSDAYLKFTLKLNSSAKNDSTITASLTTPMGDEYKMSKDDNGDFVSYLKVEEGGLFTITMINMEVYNPQIAVEVVDEPVQ